MPNFATESTLRYLNDKTTILKQLDCVVRGALAALEAFSGIPR
jgi:hypothetical protein